MGIIRALKSVNYKLLLAILSTMIFPTIYQTVRIYFLGTMPSENSFNIASQLSWLNLIYEVIQEALILPLFFLLGRCSKKTAIFANKVRTGLLIITVMYSLISIGVIIFAESLVTFMAQAPALIDETVTYIRLETIAHLFLIIWRFMSLVLLTMEKAKYIFFLLVVQMTLSILLDVFLISHLKISVQLGVNGIAISNIVVNGVMIVVTLVLLYREGITIFVREKLNFSWMREWFQIGKFSGIESLLRNLVFLFMVVRMVNVVMEQGNYWLANNFIWQWLLLPGLALADLVKKEVGENKENVRKKSFGYFILAIIFALS